MKVFFVEFTITPKCNQDCYYCDLIGKNFEGTWEMDIDYFKWIVNELAIHAPNLMIEICGGEPGICTNLESALKFLKDHKNVKISQLMSNGLVRLNRPDLIPMVDRYNEHLVKEIVHTTQEVFYDMDHVQAPNAKSVIVTTPTTTQSLLDNFSYFYDIGMFKEDKWIKPFVERTINITHHENLVTLFKLLGDDYVVEQLTKPDLAGKAICEKRPFLPCINLERGTIQHCAYHNFSNPHEVWATRENLRELVRKTLWMDARVAYCKNCYLYSRDKMLMLMGNKCNRQL